MWRADGPPCDKHFQNTGHKFNEHAKFTIIERLNNGFFPKQSRLSQQQRLLKQSLLEHR